MRQATWDAVSESSRQQITILSKPAYTVSDIDGHPGLPLAERANINDRSNLAQEVPETSHCVNTMQVTAMGLRFLYSEKIRDIPAGRNSRQPHAGHRAAFRGVAEGLSCAVRCPDRKPDKVCDQHRHRLPADSL